MKRKSMCLLLVAAMILGLLIPQLSITAFAAEDEDPDFLFIAVPSDRKSTRLNSSH